MTPKSAVLTDTGRTSQALPRSLMTVPFERSPSAVCIFATASDTALGISMSPRRSDFASSVPNRIEQQNLAADQRSEMLLHGLENGGGRMGG